MNAFRQTVNTINNQAFLAYLIMLILSTLLISYAISSMLLGVFVFFSIRYAIVNRVKPRISFELLLPILLYCLFSLSLFWTIDSSLTIKGLGREVSLILIPLAFVLIPRFSRQHYKIILHGFTIVNFLFGTLFLFAAVSNYFKVNDFSVFTYHNLVSIFDLNAIYVSTYFLISLFYLLSQTPKSKLIKFLIMFFITMIILLSSKILIVVMVLGLVLYAFLYFDKYKVRQKNILLIILALVVIFSLTSKTLIERVVEEKKANLTEIITKKKFNRVYPWTGMSFRLLQHRILYEQINEEKIFWKGFGLFASRVDLKIRHKKLNTYKGFHTYNYHSMYAQILSETGIFGLILLILILGTGLIKSIKKKDYLVIMFFTLLSLLFITESFLWVQRGLFLFIIMYCLFTNVNLAKK